jgi:hypothetical protein
MKGFGGLTSEQQSLLKRNNHGLQLLKMGGHLNIWQMIDLVWLPVTIFAFTLLCLASSVRFDNEWLVHLVLCFGLIALLAVPTIAVLVLSFGVLSTHIYSRVRWPAAIYWGYWPFWTFVLCWSAFGIASRLGNSMWYHEVLPDMQLNRLQSYHAIDPSSFRGPRFQDAGIVTFNESVGVDRAQSGCLKNAATYCVAPIVIGDEMSVANATSMHDLFMAGKDCCECPGEFRCGDWNRPTKRVGGFRIMDPTDSAFYRLAVEEWGAKYRQDSKHPIFFEWVDQPFDALADMHIRGQRLMVGLLIFAPVVIGILIHLLNLAFGVLQTRGRASPIDPPMPHAAGFGYAVSKRLLPQMHNQEYRAHQLNVGGSFAQYI